MADTTINGLTATTSAVAADEIPMWVAGSAVTRKITKANFLQGAFTGGGTVATGGFTLTVPATGTAALLNTAQTFTATQTFKPSSNAIGLALDTISGSTLNQLSVQYDGTEAAYINITATASVINLASRTHGNATPAPHITIGRNTYATESPGYLQLYEAAGGYDSLYFDNSGILRAIRNDPPVQANYATGTVIGTQTSMAAAKYLTDEVTPIGEVLASIQAAAAAAVRRFTYRSGAFNGEAFEGIVTDLAPRYGMDRDDEHPAGKALNEITLLGDLVRAVAYLSERVAALER